MSITEQRSGVASDNYQEILDAESNTGFSAGKQEAYFTPDWLVDYCQSKLPNQSPATILDPQCDTGNLLTRFGYGSWRFGVELDNRITFIPSVQLITGNCLKVFEAIDDLYPDMRFVCINANPPFGRHWKKADGKTIESTEATWQFATKRGNMGYFIASDATIQKLGIHKHPWVYGYDTKPAIDIWKNMRAELQIGIVWWQRPQDDQYTYTSGHQLTPAWDRIRKIIDEEKAWRPDYNIYLDERGYLRTYLSVRSEFKLKLKLDQVQRLHRINDTHPLTLTTEKETRHLMRDLVECGIYQIQPEAKAAIESALAEVNALACPIMPTTSFEDVAYCDEEDLLICIADCSTVKDGGGMRLTKGKSYPLTTGSYKFAEKITRTKVHYNEERMETYSQVHDCVLSGTDRYIEIQDDTGRIVRFMDRPRYKGIEFEEKELWDYFKKPEVKTVADIHAPAIKQNLAVLKACEMIAGFTYHQGQLEYLSRVGVKDCGLVAAETGAGKTLFALSLLTLKSPHRALIIAPQGTMRSSQDEDDEDAMQFDASQWLREIARFAPHLQVWEIFSYDDYQRICSLNGGELPPGVYVTYYQAFMSNGAMEKTPDSWDDVRLNKFAKANKLAELPLVEDANIKSPLKRFWCDSVGRENNGIRCIIEPCLATKIGHLFDMVLCDEAHLATNLGANLTQMLIRLQPKYRYALTATPIPNVVSNLFSLMGWLAVPGWYKGDHRNAAFPYAREDIGRFNNTFLSQERDLTQEEWNRRKDPKWRGVCIKDSPIISSPARLLKILKPTMAFISKSSCNPNYIPPEVIDVRVPMGKEQSILYAHFLDRANIEASNALVRARKQTAYLRNICADPAGFTHGGPKVTSNSNPKVLAIIELVRDILARGEQVVIINSRVGLTNTLQEKLADAGVSIARIDSTISAEQQAHQSNLFKNRKASIMLMGIRCAASHSFDQAENEIIGSLEYSNGPLTQAKGRIDRVTNKIIKKIYVILHKNSLEELMFDTVATKDDAATVCLRGQRVPRNFKPVDASEVLAKAIERFDISGSTPEPECERQWPKLRDAIRTIHKN